jgi:hypothetical protein
MRALGLLGSVAIGCLITLGTSCGSDDNKGDGGGTGGSASTGGAGGSASTGGTGGSAATGGTTGTGGSSGSGAAKFSCDYNTQGAHFCVTYDGGNIPSPTAVVQAWQSACTTGMGMSVTACSTTGAIGKCTFTSNSGGYSVSQTIFYYPPLTAATGMQLCMGNNASGVTVTWTPL